MMKNFKRFVFITLSLGFCIHISFTLIYNFDRVSSNPTLRFIVFKYMFPFFNQNNKIFAPDPPFCKQQLWVRYKNKKGVWEAYQNPQRAMLKAHVANRFSPIGTQIKHYDYVLRHIYDAHLYADYYLHVRKDTIENYDSLRLFYMNRNEGFLMAQRYFSDLLKRSGKEANYDSLQFKILFVYPEKFQSKALNNIKSSSLVISYPSLPIKATDVEQH